MEIVKLNESFIFELLNLCKSVGWLHDEIFMKTIRNVSFYRHTCRLH